MSANPVLIEAALAIRQALIDAEAQPNIAAAVATFLRGLPVAKGEALHWKLMTPETMAGLADLVEHIGSEQ